MNAAAGILLMTLGCLIVACTLLYGLYQVRLQGERDARQWIAAQIKEQNLVFSTRDFIKPIIYGASRYAPPKGPLKITMSAKFDRSPLEAFTQMIAEMYAEEIDKKIMAYAPVQPGEAKMDFDALADIGDAKAAMREAIKIINQEPPDDQPTSK